MWDALADDLAARRNKGLGDLGSGNHFLDAAASMADGSLCLVVHTGSRQESGLVDDLVEKPGEFDAAFARIRRWAANNRAAVLDIAEKHVGRFAELLPGMPRLDRDHNHVEPHGGATLIRKGSQRVLPGEVALIPSNLLDDMALVRATAKVAEIENCLPHGTGRTMSRGDAKRAAAGFDFAELRRQVYIPKRIADTSLRTEAPTCYRRLDDALALMRGYVEEVERLTPVAYIGQL
jgi:RNA-splicing ligase RtcB